MKEAQQSDPTISQVVQYVKTGKKPNIEDKVKEYFIEYIIFMVPSSIN